MKYMSNPKPVIVGIGDPRHLKPGDTLSIQGVTIEFVKDGVEVSHRIRFPIPILRRSRDIARRLAATFRAINWRAEQIGRSGKIRLWPDPAIYSKMVRVPVILKPLAIVKSSPK